MYDPEEIVKSRVLSKNTSIPQPPARSIHSLPAGCRESTGIYDPEEVEEISRPTLEPVKEEKADETPVKETPIPQPPPIPPRKSFTLPANCRESTGIYDPEEVEEITRPTLETVEEKPDETPIPQPPARSIRSLPAGSRESTGIYDPEEVEEITRPVLEPVKEEKVEETPIPPRKSFTLPANCRESTGIYDPEEVEEITRPVLEPVMEEKADETPAPQPPSIPQPPARSIHSLPANCRESTGIYDPEEVEEITRPALETVEEKAEETPIPQPPPIPPRSIHSLPANCRESTGIYDPEEVEEITRPVLEPVQEEKADEPPAEESDDELPADSNRPSETPIPQPPPILQPPARSIHSLPAGCRESTGIYDPEEVEEITHPVLEPVKEEKVDESDDELPADSNRPSVTPTPVTPIPQPRPRNAPLPANCLVSTGIYDPEEVVEEEDHPALEPIKEEKHDETPVRETPTRSPIYNSVKSSGMYDPEEVEDSPAPPPPAKSDESDDDLPADLPATETPKADPLYRISGISELSLDEAAFQEMIDRQSIFTPNTSLRPSTQPVATTEIPAISATRISSASSDITSTSHMIDLSGQTELLRMTTSTVNQGGLNFLPEAEEPLSVEIPSTQVVPSVQTAIKRVNGEAENREAEAVEASGFGATQEESEQHEHDQLDRDVLGRELEEAGEEEEEEEEEMRGCWGCRR